MRFVYVIARAGVKFGINFTSCSENGNFVCSFLPVLLLIASFVKVKFQTLFQDKYALLTPARHTVKVESRSGLD